MTGLLRSWADAMRAILVILLAVSVAGCGADATSPELTSTPVPPTATLVAPDAPTESPPPVVSPRAATPTPSPSATHPSPSPSPTLVAGWPSVSQQGVTMSGRRFIFGPPLRLRVKLTGLVPGERVRLRATARYRILYGCGACDYEGLCPATDSVTMRGTARATARAVAGDDGVASATITLTVPRPRTACPAARPTIWGSSGGRWTRIRVTDPAHLLRLTAPTQESYDIF